MPDDITAPNIQVDAGLCEGHALCIQLAPDVFDLSDDEVASVVATPPAGHLDDVKAAVDACPRQAITLLNPSTKGQ